MFQMHGGKTQSRMTEKCNKFKESYYSFFNKHKTHAFVKNMITAGIPFFMGGIVGARATSALTLSPAAVSIGSITGQYLLGTPAFGSLHYLDNKEIYRDKDGIKWKLLATDIAKLTFALGVLDGAYLAARPVLVYQFLKNGVDPVAASVYADSITFPIYWALAVPVAKSIGVLK